MRRLISSASGDVGLMALKLALKLPLLSLELVAASSSNMAVWILWKLLFMVVFSSESMIVAGEPCYDSQGLQWKCINTDTCIWNNWRCDSNDDCDDGSDEKDCVHCNFGFHCNNNKCISHFMTCDNKDDCGDNSDESSAAGCIPWPVHRSTEAVDPDCDDHYYWKCHDTSKCILDSNRCNGEVDCNDGSDELHCEACKDSAFLCKNRKCIPTFLVCNEINNCGDNSDESCPAPPDLGDSVSSVSNIVGKFFGGIVGGAAGFILLLIAIIAIIIVVCVCNKRCPLYKRRQRERPPVVVIDGIQPAPEENAPENLSLIKNDEFDESNIKKGVEENCKPRGIAQCHEDWCSNAYLDY